MRDSLRIVAILMVRNGRAYIRRCLDHLIAQGIEVIVIDHSSTDGTRAAAEEYLGRGVVQVEKLPFEGDYALGERLEVAERIIRTTSSDWFINHDVDEIMEAPSPFRTLREGIEAVNQQGYNVINFDEFVFLPTSEDEDHEGGDYVSTMTRYYFFEPRPQRLMRAFKKPPSGKVDIRSHARHRVKLPDPKIYPGSFILRHYIALSRRQLIRKYVGRVHKLDVIKERGWSVDRAVTRPGDITLPDPARLKVVDSNRGWDRGDPWREHGFLGDPGRLSRASITAAAAHELTDQPPMPMIVGASRSGATRLRRMLASHPSIAIPPPTHFIPRLARLRTPDRESFLEILTDRHTWSAFDLDADRLRAELERVAPFNATAGLRAFYRLYARQRGKGRWGDGTPVYGLYMAVVASVMPEARFIHVVRDGRDVAVSLRHLPFGPGEQMEDQATDWVWRIREARQQASSLPHYLEIRYEDLVARPRDVMLEVCRFIELPFDPVILSYYPTAAERIAEPPEPDRERLWRTGMTTSERREVEAIAGEMLSDLGYEM